MKLISFKYLFTPSYSKNSFLRALEELIEMLLWNFALGKVGSLIRILNIKLPILNRKNLKTKILQVLQVVRGKRKLKGNKQEPRVLEHLQIGLE